MPLLKILVSDSDGSSWQLNSTTFVGHPMPVAVTSFSPRIYKVQGGSTDNTSSSGGKPDVTTCYCALGSTDGKATDVQPVKHGVCLRVSMDGLTVVRL